MHHRVLHAAALALDSMPILNNASAAVCQQQQNQQPSAVMEQLDVFVSSHYGGSEDYHTFRIPTLVITTHGTLLAVVEGRKDSRGDLSNVHLVCKRSMDGGRSWSPLIPIHHEPGISEGGDVDVTTGNPCPVVDEETGEIHVIFCRNNMQAFATTSVDDGVSWTPPRAIPLNASMGQRGLDGQFWAGPGHGIQLKRGPKAGRLIIPCHRNQIEPSYGFRAHMLYSDDHGSSICPNAFLILALPSSTHCPSAALVYQSLITGEL
eukprot:COSAG05_NODE_519_length_9047_cov_25.276263_9_plen_263_part_00